MDTKTAMFWSDFADKFADDESCARFMRDNLRARPIQACRDTIKAARAHLADPLFNLQVAREIIRDINERAGDIEHA